MRKTKTKKSTYVILRVKMIKEVNSDRLSRAKKCLEKLKEICDNDLMFVGVSVKTDANNDFQVPDTTRVDLHFFVEYWLKQAWDTMNALYGGTPSTFKGAILYIHQTQDALREFIRRAK